MEDLAVEVVLTLIDKVLSFLYEEIDRNKNVVNDLKEIKANMSSMKACLRDADGGAVADSEMMKDLVHQIRDLSHEMEDVLDEFMIHAPRHFSQHSLIQRMYLFGHDVKHWVPIIHLQSQIGFIKKRTSEIRSSSTFDELARKKPSEEGSHLKPREQEIAEGDDVVGIDSPKRNLIHLVMSNSRCSTRKTISVVGPGGSGKTVLVNAIYKDKTVIDQFDFHAWLSIPNSSSWEQLLQKLVSRIGIDLPSRSGDPATNLRNYLKGKRYLVVLDYVWKHQDLTDIRSKLPDDRNGSIIIITTRNEVVAVKCCTQEGWLFRVNGLEPEDSWTLFCKKAFGSTCGKCPPHLQELAQGIVIRCEGLPQAISEVGSLLSMKQNQPAEWKRIHENIGAHIQANCSSTMLPSYYDLPRYTNLKSCFLYFSILPEDCSIKRERLVRLWLSEGLVNKHFNEPLETTAEEYLNELISRNLVTVSSRDFRGRVRSCRVQNPMRELVLQKSKEDKFIEVVTHSRSGVNMKEIRRLSCIQDLGFTGDKGFWLHTVRSLFVFGLGISSSSMLLEILQGVRLLKILDLENAPLDTFPDCILDVALLLKYLSLRNTKVSIVPKKIERLRYLEYLDLKETQVSRLPEEICSLQNLQHLLVHRFIPTKNESFDRIQGVEIVGTFKVLKFLQKLSIINISHDPGFFNVLQQLTLLKKLGLANLSKDDGKSLCGSIEKMTNLSTLSLTSTRNEYLDLNHMVVYPKFLQHLYLKGMLTVLPEWIPSLSSLVRLLLKWSKLSKSPIESLKYMPSLMELEMVDAFTGEVLVFEARGFQNLTTLRIEQFDGLDTIQVYAGAMPMLQKLTIVRCQVLKDLHFGIQELKCLEEVLLYDMPQDFTRKLRGDFQRANHVPRIHSYTANANGEWEIRNLS